MKSPSIRQELGGLLCSARDVLLLKKKKLSLWKNLRQKEFPTGVFTCTQSQKWNWFGDAGLFRLIFSAVFPFDDAWMHGG